MHGAIAAGSSATADAGATVLKRGGNAVDAAVAACFATAAGEPALTSLAGGGVMLHRDGGSGEVTICDFFANAPGVGGRQPKDLEFFPVDLRFGPALQRFYIGAGAAAVPGVIPGLCTALERWGSMTLEEVVRPACGFLRDGVTVEPLQAQTVRLLEPILMRAEEGRRQFGVEGRLVQEGDSYRVPELADLLEALARGDWRKTYEDLLVGPVLRQFGHGAGGLITREDMAAYEVRFREPLRVTYRDAVVFTNPPPAAGGTMIALMLALLEEEDVARLAPGGREHVLALCRAMRVADEARAARGGQGLLEDASRLGPRFRELAGQPLGAGPAVDGGPGSTTHVSVVDAAGNVASVTFSYGEGCGVLIENTGIMMNNLMGEEDLFPQGLHRWPSGARLSTMMSPTVIVSDGDQVTALGSGGANRIRTTLTQVISGMVDFGLTPHAVVALPRVHFEQGVLNAETFGRADGGVFLERLGADHVLLFREPNLFFGGVHLVQRSGNGTLGGAGDPRRSGVCRIV